MTEVTTLPAVRIQAMSVQDIEAEVTRLMASPAFRAQAGSEADAIALALRGRDLGLPPSTAINGLYTVKGRVSCETWLLMALVERDNLCESLTWEFQGTAPPDLAITVTTQRRGRLSSNTESLSWAEIERAGLAGKGVWPLYPKIMLRWRAIAQLYRVVYPDSVGGMYLPGELPDDTVPVTVTSDGDLVRDPELAHQDQDVQSEKTDILAAQVSHALKANQAASLSGDQATPEDNLIRDMRAIAGPWSAGSTGPATEARARLKEDQPEYLSDDQASDISVLAGRLDLSDEALELGVAGVTGRTDLEHWTYMSPEEATKVIQRMETKAKGA